MVEAAADSSKADQGNIKPPNPSPPPGAPAGRWITWRSAILGTLCVIVLCALAPFNDYVVYNTYMVGCFVPVALAIVFFFLIVMVNAPLHRFKPAWVLSGGELGVIMAMMLVACGICTSGLMRYLVPLPVSVFHYGQTNPEFWDVFAKIDLPRWLFPVPDIQTGRSNPIVTEFINRVQEGSSIPYTAWIVPLAAWGVFMGATMAVMLGIAMILRYQWAVNERLAFPIAQFQLALIEAPRPGKMLNELLGNRLFWMALGAVVVIHSSMALNRYSPKHIPEIPIRYDLGTIMANEPWLYFSRYVKANQIFFTYLGITYFIQARIGFSLWSIFLIMDLVTVQQRMAQNDIPAGAWADQHFGACIAFVLGTLWIGRQHWARVVRQTFAGPRPGESRADFVTYRTALIVVLVGLAVMMGWLLVMGVKVWVALTIVGFMMLTHFVVARIVAETGMPCIRCQVGLPQVYTNVAPAALSGKDMFFLGSFSILGGPATRESELTFALHGLEVAADSSPPPRQRRGMVALMVWAMVLAFVVAAISWLYCHYTYVTPLTPTVSALINDDGLESKPRGEIVDPLVRWQTGRFADKQHNPAVHIGIGAGVTGLLQFAALRWSAWPLMPVGYLVAPTWYAGSAWFSIFLGWLAKVMLLKFGGARLYQRARPVFVGLIFGEAMAAGLWLIITLILAWLGVDYYPAKFLPI